MADSEDVFILYNEQEQGIEAFVAALREADVSTYFFRSDFPLGGEIVKLESAKLTAARAVVIFLGSHGWGPTQREIARNAVQMGKIILPFTLGDPPTEALSDVDALFTDRLRIDLKEPSQESYGRFVSSVVDALRRLPDEPLHSEGLRYDGIFTTLIDGSEADRLALLNRIIDRGVTNPSALAHKLIASIKERFSASNELESGRAVRDPKRLESVRSWMLSVLIWLGELDEEGTKTILDHINHRYEPEKAVRFWTLAGAINAQRSYRQAAIELARQDPAPEVSGLAEIAFDRENEKTLRGFRSAISSAQFEVVWPILRILRVFPLPSLADDVVALLNQPSQGLVYDVLFALSAHEMSAAARSHILAQITLSDLVQLVIGESRSSTPISLTAFAGVLSVFDLGEVKAALQAAAQDDEDKQIVRKILDVLLGMHPGADSDPQIPGHAADKIDITKDDIGIRRDIQTLASVMLARDVDPPLAIGLFGEWGSGKSFYMKSLEAAVEDIASRASKHTGPFCSNVVQINFNAWHYVDANLWASLVSHMLDGLAEHLEPKLTSTEQRAALAKDLVSAKSEMELANLERKLASSQLETTTKALQTKILEREQSEVKLRDLRAGDLMAVLTANPTLKTDLQSALDAVGAPAAFESAAELNAVIQESYETTGRAYSLLVSIVRGRNLWIGLAGIIVFFVVPPVILWLVSLGMPFAPDITEWIAKATVAVGTITLVLRSALNKVSVAFRALSTAKRKVDEQLATKRVTPSKNEEELQEQVAAARASENAAAERVSVATTRVQEIEGHAAALEDSQSLGYFIAERSRSDDYRRHLGLISLIRKDFDGLVDRIRIKTDGTKGIDRIILYIDDVDRCPPEMVVDILQAVHLLLAYDLFVVVVSVDPRWLLRSLQTQMPQFEDVDASPIAAARATPQDYLEKIFQVPFTVRPMGEVGFARLMGRLLPSTVSADPVPQPQEGQTTGATSPASGPDTGATNKADAPENNAATAFAASVPSAGEPDIEPIIVEPEISTDALVISQAETEFAQRLHMLLTTPRSAKRFTNIYRLLKASLSRGDLAAFEGRHTVPGDFQLPMLLLALLVGRPALAGEIFPLLLAQARDENQQWWDAGWDSQTGSGENTRLRAQLSAITAETNFPYQPELVVKWLPHVSRYSFTTAAIFLQESS